MPFVTAIVPSLKFEFWGDSPDNDLVGIANCETSAIYRNLSQKGTKVLLRIFECRRPDNRGLVIFVWNNAKLDVSKHYIGNLTGGLRLRCYATNHNGC